MLLVFLLLIFKLENAQLMDAKPLEPVVVHNAKVDMNLIMENAFSITVLKLSMEVALPAKDPTDYQLMAVFNKPPIHAKLVDQDIYF